MFQHDAEATRIYLHPALAGCGRPVIGWRCRTYVNGATHPLRPPSRVQCWAAPAGLPARYSLPSSAIPENVLSQEVQIVTQDEKKNKKGKPKGTSRQVDRERVKNSPLTSSRANMRRNGSQHSLGSLSRTGSQTDVSASRTDSSAESPMTDSHEYTKVPHKASRNGIHHSLQSTSKILASKLRTQHSNRTNRVKMQTGSDGQMNHTQAVGRHT